MKLGTRQQGFTLGSIVLVGFLVVTMIAYGRHVAGLVFNKSKIQSVIENVATSEKTDMQARVKFDQLVAFENIKAVKGEDLDITVDGEQLSIAVSYRECAPIAGKWEVCTSWDLKSSK